MAAGQTAGTVRDHSELIQALVAHLQQPDTDPRSLLALLPPGPSLDAAAVSRLADELKAESEKQLHLSPRRAEDIGHVIRELGVRHARDDVAALGELAVADAQRDQGAYPHALEAYERAAALFERAGERVGWARTRIGAAATRRVTGELARALEEAEAARPVLQAAGAWGRLARLESVIGLVLRELGRYPDALDAYARARDAAARLEHEARALMSAELWINEALVRLRIDQYELAERQLGEAAAIFQEYGRLAPMAQAEANRASVLAAQGRVSEALRLVNDVRARLRSLGRIAEAAMVGQVGVQSWLLLNRPTEASALADEVVSELEAHAAGNELARTLLDRAVAREELGRSDEAIADLVRAEEVFAGCGSATWVAFVQLRRAEVLQRAGRLPRALDEARRAAASLRQHHEVARARALLVEAHAALAVGDLSLTRRLARRAYAIARRRGVLWLEYQACRLSAEATLAEGNPRGALNALDSAIRSLERSQGRILIEQRPAFLSDKLGVYESALRLTVQLGMPRRAFQYAERAKSRALLDALALGSRAPAESLKAETPAARVLADELAQLRRRHDRLSDLLTPQSLAPTDEPLGGPAGARVQLADQLAQDEARMAAIVEELRLGEGADMERLALLQGKVYSPLKRLGPRTALVEFMAVGGDIAVFVLRRGRGVRATWVPGQDALARVARLRGALDLALNSAVYARGHPDQLLEREHHMRGILSRLYTLLLAPVSDLLDGVDHLVVVPHGVLHCLPFAALHDGERYLVERCVVSLAPSASAVAFCRRPVRARGPDGPRAAIVGHSGGGLLPGALAEAELVHGLFAGQRLLESEATVDAVRAAVASADLIHIAAHGISRPEAPLFSHVRLEDGQLTALDCLDLNLECDLVTLSACETGRSVVAPGDDLIGLTRSLLYAGARSVVQSLWRVDDAATRDVMSSFYRHLRRGGGRGAALRAAQSELLRDERRAGYRHPFFWAAFTLVGDWSPLPSRGAR